MAYKVVLPQVDANMQEGTLSRWHVHRGDWVVKGEPLVELQTDKATFDIESPAEGTVLAIIAPDRSVLPPGYIIAIIGDQGEPLPAYHKENEDLIKKNNPFAALDAKIPTPSHERTSKKPRVRATPSARRLAKDHGLELGELQRTTGCEVVTEDIVRGFLDGD